MAECSARDQEKGASVVTTQQGAITAIGSQLYAARLELRLSNAQRDECVAE